MNINKTVNGDTVSLALSGRLDTVTYSELVSELEQVFAQENVNLIFDLSDLDYISSAGLRVFLTVQKKVNAFGTAMKIIGAVPNVKEVFELTGFTEIMTFE
ncbi:MAG: STAS domain-containing protein [Syntrophomonadaceae bacterium]|nr:STAS domain-containing protein [Syntrophomonadaceae bacterium]